MVPRRWAGKVLCEPRYRIDTHGYGEFADRLRRLRDIPDSAPGEKAHDREVRRTTVVIICAWCCRVLRHGHGPVSHGICVPCRRRVEAEYAPATREA